jgi:hypothetical protein
MKAYCPSWLLHPRASGLQATVKAHPFIRGWKLAHWRGACTGKKLTCTINLTHFPSDGQGVRHAWVTAVFVATMPGFTRSWPVPIGQAGGGDGTGGFRLKVNFATPEANLSPAAPAGSEYFVANITATYFGNGSNVDIFHTAQGKLAAVGRANPPTSVPYTAAKNGCPGNGPAPQLAALPPFNYGQSATGNVCWTITTSDEASLQMYYGGGYKTWFALH